MALPLTTAQAEIISRAYTVGVETSIKDLADLLDLAGEGKLAAAGQVVEFVDSLQLELVPGSDVAEFESVRVLRAGAPSVDPHAHIQNLLKSGEGPSIEFKSSMLCSMRDWEETGKRVEHPSLSGEVLKTLCAFLNSGGGDLLVGVKDDAVPCVGVNLDLELMKWNLDKWELHFQSLVASRFFDSPQIPRYLRTRMVEINSVPVFHVTVMPRGDRSFVKKEKGKPYEFFLRNGPRTDSLDLPAFYGHLTAT